MILNIEHCLYESAQGNQKPLIELINNLTSIHSLIDYMLIQLCIPMPIIIGTLENLGLYLVH